MKKVWFTLCIVFLYVSVDAQPKTEAERKKKKIDKIFELLGYVNCSTITGESESYNGLLVGGQVGAQVNLGQFSDQFSVWGGMAYSMQGGKYGGGDSDYGGSYGEGSVRLNYLNFPILARYQTPGGFFVEGGLQPGLLLSAKDKNDYNGSSGSADIKDQFNSFDFGIPIGAGYKFKNNLGVGLRVVPGVTNINKKEDTYTPAKDRNLVISVGASYAF